MHRTAAALDWNVQGATLVDVLRWRATHTPDNLGYRFLVDGDLREACLSYGELERRSSAIAAKLQSLDAAGERVLLVYPPGLEFICSWFGCAQAAAIPVAVPPPQSARARRFASNAAAIARDAQPTVVLTTAPLEEQLGVLLAEAGGLPTVRWLITDRLVWDEYATGVDKPVVTDDDVAFLQYTSGSTTAPRGVVVTHANLMHNLAAIRDSGFWQSSDMGSVSWLPPYHDMGLIGAILAPLYVGSPVTLMSPIAFIQRPRRWLQALSRYGGAVSGGPNFAYDLCVRKVSPKQSDDLDLSDWRVAFSGAEPVNPRTIREFTARFAPCGFAPDAFKPCYGLAESTLLVSVNARPAPPRIRSFQRSALERHRAAPCADDADGARALVSCGQPVTETVIVDPRSSRPCVPGEVGEIWVAGASVARGYWNQPAETERTFCAALAPPAGGRFLRTGDLGFVLEGELFVTGRLKDLIIIDGANHYPQDIERTVGTSHPDLAPTDCAAFSVDADGAEALVVVAGIPPSSRIAAPDLDRAIRAAVSEYHDLRIYDLLLVQRGAIPKTPSGKIRRHACRAAYLERTLLQVEAP